MPSNQVGAKIVQYVVMALGIEYILGAESFNGPMRGFDCSGLVWWAHDQSGVKFDRTTARVQYNMAEKIPYENMAMGDSVFYGDPAVDVFHVAVYVGAGWIIQAPDIGRVVEYAYADLFGGNQVTLSGRLYPY
jgi:cell wall-associated NlpC family hydrolase